MTNNEIIQNIIDNDCVDEIFETLRQIRERRFNDLKAELSEQNATLRLIKKLSKEETIQDILSE